MHQYIYNKIDIKIYKKYLSKKKGLPLCDSINFFSKRCKPISELWQSLYVRNKDEIKRH